MNAIQAGKIYTGDHPKFKEYLNRLYGVVQEILEDRKELVLGIIGGEAAWEDEIFFNLRGKLGLLIDFLEKNGVERIIFQQGLRFEELREFIIFLTRVKRQEKISEQEYFSLHGIQNIRAGKLRTMVKGEADATEAEETRTRYESSVQHRLQRPQRRPGEGGGRLPRPALQHPRHHGGFRRAPPGAPQSRLGQAARPGDLRPPPQRHPAFDVLRLEAPVRQGRRPRPGHRRPLPRRRQALHLAQGHPEGEQAVRGRIPAGPQPPPPRGPDPRGLQGRPGHPADRRLLRAPPPLRHDRLPQVALLPQAPPGLDDGLHLRRLRRPGPQALL